MQGKAARVLAQSYGEQHNYHSLHCAPEWLLSVSPLIRHLLAAHNSLTVTALRNCLLKFELFLHTAAAAYNYSTSYQYYPTAAHYQQMG